MLHNAVKYGMVAALIVCLALIVLSEGRAQNCYSTTIINSDGSVKFCTVCSYGGAQTITCM